MPTPTLIQGPPITVGDLEVGDVIYLRERRSSNRVGLPVPVHPAVVTDLDPTLQGTVGVHVRNAGSAPTVDARYLGQLPLDREFRLAAVAGRVPEAPTQTGNVVTIPASEAFSYRDADRGTDLTAGPLTLRNDAATTLTAILDAAGKSLGGDVDAEFAQAVSVQIAGTFTGTLVFETSMDGVTWTAKSLDVSGGGTAQSATAPGTFSGTLGAKRFRVRASALSSGTATVIVKYAPASANLHITAVPNDGYEVDSGATASWTFAYAPGA